MTFSDPVFSSLLNSSHKQYQDTTGFRVIDVRQIVYIIIIFETWHKLSLLSSCLRHKLGPVSIMEMKMDVCLLRTEQNVKKKKTSQIYGLTRKKCNVH